MGAKMVVNEVEFKVGEEVEVIAYKSPYADGKDLDTIVGFHFEHGIGTVILKSGRHRELFEVRKIIK